MERKQYFYKFNNLNDYDENKKNISIKPYVVLIDDTKEIIFEKLINYKKEYFTLVALQSGSISISKPNGNSNLYYSFNNQKWIEITESISIQMEENDKVMLKGNGDSFNSSSSLKAFSTTMPFNAEGNILSLLYNDEFESIVMLDEPSTFSYLFANTSIVSAKNLILSPIMLASNCYYSMFYGCSSLTTAPELPATTLAEGCYQSMFEGCSKLKESPVLIAPRLENGCYKSMFNGCTSLNKITMLAIDIRTTDCLFDWVNGVASSGTFIKHEFMTSLENSSNGIPEGWTDENSTVNYFYVFNVRDVSQNLQTFYCENGMRWVDYIPSKYNVYGFKIENDNVFLGMGILMNGSSGIYVRPDELIVNGVTYNQIPN